VREIEDRYSEKSNYTFKGYAKIAIEFQDCDVAKKTIDPSKVRDMASLPFTEQLKNTKIKLRAPKSPMQAYLLICPRIQSQDYSRILYHDDSHFFVVREYCGLPKADGYFVASGNLRTFCSRYSCLFAKCFSKLQIRFKLMKQKIRRSKTTPTRVVF